MEKLHLKQMRCPILRGAFYVTSLSDRASASGCKQGCIGRGERMCTVVHLDAVLWRRTTCYVASCSLPSTATGSRTGCIAMSLAERKNLRKEIHSIGASLIRSASSISVPMDDLSVCSDADAANPCSETHQHASVHQVLQEEDHSASYNSTEKTSDFLFQESKAFETVCILLRDRGWGLGTEIELVQFGEYLSPYFVYRVLRMQTDPKLALCFFSWVGQQSGYRHEMYTFHQMLRILGNAQEYEALWQLVLEMNEDGYKVTTSTMGLIINCYGAAGMMDEAIGVLYKLEDFGCVPTPFLYNTVLNLLVKTNRVQRAQLLFDEMWASQCSPDIATFNILISGYCNDSRFDEAKSLLKKMKTSEHPADAITYSTLICRLSEVGKVDEAVRFLDEMRDKGYTPIIKVLNKLLVALCKASRFEDAVNYLQTIECSAAGATSYTLVINALCRLSQPDKVSKLVNMMKEKGFPLDDFLCKKLLMFFSEIGRMSEVFAVLEDCHLKGISLPETYMQILLNISKTGKVQLVPPLLNKLLDMGFTPDDFAYSKLVSLLCIIGEPLVSCRVLTMMLRKGHILNVAICNKVLEGLCKKGNIGMALQFFNDLKRWNLPNDFTYATVLRALCNANRMDMACGILDAAIKRGVTLDRGTLNILIDDLPKAGKLEVARQLFDKASKMGNGTTHMSTCNAFFKALCRAGNMEAACMFLDEMVEKGYEPDVYTYGIMIHSLCQANKVDQGYKLLSAMKKKGCSPDLVCYSTVVSGFVKSGKVQTVSKLMDEMAAAGVSPDIVTYNTLMHGFLKAGDVDRCLQLWEEIKTCGCKPDRASYHLLIDGLCGLGKAREAFRIVHEMLDSGATPDNRVLEKLLHHVDKHRNDAETQDLLDKVSKSGLKLLHIAYEDNSCNLHRLQIETG